MVWLLRKLLVETSDERLCLCLDYPKEWYKEGETISVQNAPTKLGYVSYTIKFEANVVSAEIYLPAEHSIKELCIGLLPNKETTSTPEVNGADFDKWQGRNLCLKKMKEKVVIRVKL
jgi:hypothetical protein